MDEKQSLNQPQTANTGNIPVQPPIVPPPPFPMPGVAKPQSTLGSQVQPANPGNAVEPPSPKRSGFPKLLVLIVGILIVAAMTFYGYKLFTGRKPVSSGEITWWGLWEDEQVVKPLIEDFQSKNPGIKVKYVKQSPQDYRERLVNAMAKGDAPDIFRFHNSWVPMLVNDLDNVPASVMSASDYAQSYFSVITDNATNGSNLVGIPLGYDALTLYINEDMFNEAGIDPPTTWVEVREKAKLLTKIENDVITQAGVALGRTENVDHWPEIIGLMFLQNGVNMSNPQGKLAEDALTFYSLFSNTDLVWDETMPPSTTAFATGKLAMYFGPSWRYFDIKQANPGLKFRTIPLPQLPKESPDEPNVSYATYWLEGVWVKSKNKDASWNFLKFISSKDSLEKRLMQSWKQYP